MRDVLVRAIVSAVGLLLAAFLLVDWNAIYFAGGAQETDDAQLRGDPTVIEAEVPGLLTGEHVGDDRSVHRGELLFTIEQDTYVAAIHAALAALEQQRGTLQLMEAERRAQEDQLRGAEHMVASDHARLAFALADRARYDALVGTPGDLRRARESAAAAARQTGETVRSDAADVEGRRRSIEGYDRRIEAQRRMIAGSENALRLAGISLGWTRIVAPEDGVVAIRAAHVGQYVQPGTPLIRFVPLPRVWAVAWYREEQIHLMRVGQHADIHVDAFPRLVLHGCVAAFGPTAQSWTETMPPDQATGTFTKVVQRLPVKITFPPVGRPDRDVLARMLVPGLNVETRVHTDGPADCLPPAGR